MPKTLGDECFVDPNLFSTMLPRAELVWATWTRPTSPQNVELEP